MIPGYNQLEEFDRLEFQEATCGHSQGKLGRSVT